MAKMVMLCYTFFTARTHLLLVKALSQVSPVLAGWFCALGKSGSAWSSQSPIQIEAVDPGNSPPGPAAEGSCLCGQFPCSSPLGTRELRREQAQQQQAPGVPAGSPALKSSCLGSVCAVAVWQEASGSVIPVNQRGTPTSRDIPLT